MTAPRTVRVRAAVAVDRQGNWYVIGWSAQDAVTARQHQVDQSLSNVLPGAVQRWIWADLPVPAPAEVEAQVEGQPNG